MKQLILPAVLVLGLGQAASAAVFSENFDAENGGATQLNYNSFAQFSVIDGAVDLIGAVNPYGISCVSGSCVDLDGTMSNSGFMYSSTFGLTSGKDYSLSFAISGNQRGGASDTTTYGIYTAALAPVAGLTSSVSKAFSEPFETIVLNFTAASTGSFVIAFENAGGDNIGMILDNVLLEDVTGPISAVPVPATLPLLLAGLGAIGLRRRRAKS